MEIVSTFFAILPFLLIGGLLIGSLIMSEGARVFAMIIVLAIFIAAWLEWGAHYLRTHF